MTDVTLVDFLLARIAEDQEVAEIALRAVDADRTEYAAKLHRRTGPLSTTTAASHCGQDMGPRGTVEALPGRVLAECAAKRSIIDLHRGWPVLVETPPKLELQPTDVAGATYRMTQQITWTTEQQYRERFGVEPPTTPMLRAMAVVYADHPDYRQEWSR